jgi:hypothetical protein
MNQSTISLPLIVSHAQAVRLFDSVRTGHKSVRFAAAILDWTPEQVQVCAFGEVVQCHSPSTNSLA